MWSAREKKSQINDLSLDNPPQCHLKVDWNFTIEISTRQQAPDFLFCADKPVVKNGTPIGDARDVGGQVTKV